MSKSRCLLGVVLTLLMLLTAPALANHEGAAPPQAPPQTAPAPSGQEGTGSPAGAPGDGDDGSTLVSVATLVGLLVLSGAVVVVTQFRGRRSPPAGQSE